MLIVIEPVTERDDYITDVNYTEVTLIPTRAPAVEPSEQKGDVRLIDVSGPNDSHVDVSQWNVGNSLG